jgi:hypothetical protein
MNKANKNLAGDGLPEPFFPRQNQDCRYRCHVAMTKSSLEEIRSPLSRRAPSSRPAFLSRQA